MPSPRSSSSSVAVSGGSRRMTLPYSPQERSSRPCSRRRGRRPPSRPRPKAPRARARASSRARAPRRSPRAREAISSSRVRSRRPIVLGALAEARLGELVEHGARGGARDRVAAERAAEAAGVRRVHQLRAPGDGRRAAGRRRASCRRRAGRARRPSARSPRRARSPAAGLHLVGDIDDPVPLADLLQRADRTRRASG